jgi:hypothetical protein
MGVKLAQHHGSWVLRFNVNRWRKTHSLGQVDQVPKALAKKALEIARAELALGTSAAGPVDLPADAGSRDGLHGRPGLRRLRGSQSALSDAT